MSTLSGNQKKPVEALSGILDEVIGLFGASSASVCLINADSDKLLIEVERGLSKSSKGFELPMGVGITGWVALSGEPFLCPNVSEEERYFQLDDRIQSEMAAPLIEGGRTVGALNVDSMEVLYLGSHHRITPHELISTNQDAGTPDRGIGNGG